MRWTRAVVGVVASLASFASTAATSDDVPGERERTHAAPQRRETTGFATSGPRFYVWEEDFQQGREWAAELLPAASAAGAANSGFPTSE